MAEDDIQGDRPRPRRSPEELSRYEVFYGKDEFEREFERSIHKFSLVSKDDMRQAILDSLIKANESVIRRWQNVSIAAAFNADSPGEAEKEMRQILTTLRSFMDRRVKMEKMLAHFESQYDEEMQSQGAGMRNAGIAATIVSAVVGLVGMLFALLGHH